MITNRKGLGRLLAGAISLAAAAGIGVVGGTLTSMVDDPAAAHAAASRSSIVTIAQRELNATSHNREVGGDQCNFYSGQLGTGNPDPCSGGYRSVAWCADFAKYVWTQAGITSVSGLNSYADSFRTYGINRGTWHTRASGYVPKPGDAVVFDWNLPFDPSRLEPDGTPDIDHVGIVTSVSGGRVYTVEGNTTDPGGGRDKVNAKSHATSYANIIGYTSPVGLKAGAISDYTGDGISDIAVFRPSTGEWIRQGSVMLTGWGEPGDIPLAGDYTGDGITDIAVFRPSTGEWIRQGSVMLTGWGGPGDIPLSGDYTGDGITDIAVFRPSTGEWIRQGHVMLTGWGEPGDIPLSGDYNGDGITDIAVYRPSTGEWIKQGGIMVSNWGEPGDIPLSGDYNGDGYSDIAVYRPSNGSWIKIGATMLTGWGNSTDLPTAGAYYTSSGSCGMAMAQSAGPVC